MSKFSVLKSIHKELADSGDVQSILGDEKEDIQLESGKKIQGLKLLENQEDIQYTVEQNKDSIIAKLMVDLPKLNKGKVKIKALNRFIKDYLISLSIDDDGDLLIKLDYYLELYELYSLDQSEKINKEILVDKDRFSKAKVLFELLYNNTLLPDYKDQKQFNEEMLKFIPRLEKSINKFVLRRSPIVIPPVNARKVMNYLRDMQTFRASGASVIKGGLIKQIAYDFYLGEKIAINEANEYSFSFLVNDKSLLSRNEFLTYVNEILGAKNIQDGKEFFLESDRFFNYSIYIGEEMFSNEGIINEETDEDGFVYEGFEVKVYAETKRNIDVEEEFSNICINLPAITERVIKDIYETYGRLNGGEEGFPDKPFVFKVEKILNVRYDGDSGEFDDYLDDKGPKLSTGGKGAEKYKFYESKDIDYVLSDLILSEKLREEIEDILDFYEDIEFYIDNNGDSPKGILLYGPPGTGKTTTVLVIAKESGAGVFVPNANQEDSLVGESANNIQKVVDAAKGFIDETGKPAIIFFDEADSLFSQRGGNVKDFKEGMLSVLLQEMDGFDKKYEGKLTFVFGTNRRDIFDKAVLSRIDKHLEIPLPTKEAREKILDLHIAKKMNYLKETVNMYENADIDLEEIAEKLEGKSGRYIKNLVRNVHNKALKLYKKASKKSEKFIITNELFYNSIKYTDDTQETLDKIMGFKI